MQMNQPPSELEGINLHPLTQVEIDDKPWKYVGYKEFTKYMSSDDDCFTLRRFDRIHCRILLGLQNRIVFLEKKLDTMDAQFSERDALDFDNGCLGKDKSERVALLKDIHQRVIEYDGLLVQFLQLKARQKPSSTVVGNLKAWLQNANNPIHPEEIKFLDCHDLVSFSNIKKSYARLFLEDRLLHLTKGLWGLVSHKNKLDSAADEHTVHCDDDALNRLANMGVFFVTLVMLILPLWILALVSSQLWRLAIITLFLLCFVSVLTWATLARPFEVLAATAGYSAVLVVFLQFGAAN